MERCWIEKYSENDQMRSVISSLAFLVIVSVANADDGHWQSLFDGKSLEGWNAKDLDECFKVQDGAIVAGGGPLARLSYVGPVNKHDFKNFELKIEVMAKPGSNGGVFHTGPQSKFLKKGYEAQDKPEACSSLRISTRHP